VVAEEGIDNGVVLLMTKKVGWQKEKCTAHVSRDDYAIVVVDIQAEVIAIEVEVQPISKSEHFWPSRTLYEGRQTKTA
jgi:hypothetical protein